MKKLSCHLEIGFETGLSANTNVNYYTRLLSASPVCIV